MEGFVAIVYTTSATLRFKSLMMRGAICVNARTIAGSYNDFFNVKYIPITLNMPLTHRYMYRTSQEIILVGKKHNDTFKQASLVQSHKTQY